MDEDLKCITSAILLRPCSFTPHPTQNRQTKTHTCFSVKLSLLENMTTVLCMAFSSSSLSGYGVSIVVICHKKIHAIIKHSVMTYHFNRKLVRVNMTNWDAHTIMY